MYIVGCSISKYVIVVADVRFTGTCILEAETVTTIELVVTTVESVRTSLLNDTIVRVKL